MGGVARLYISALAILAILGLLGVPRVFGQQDLDASVGSIVKDLEYLDSRYVNISGLVADLDRAVDLASRGNYSEAIAIINSVRGNVSLLMGTADRVYLYNSIARYGSAAAVLSLPLIVYFFLPRLYLALWFRSRRRWVVRVRRRAGK